MLLVLRHTGCIAYSTTAVHEGTSFLCTDTKIGEGSNKKRHETTCSIGQQVCVLGDCTVCQSGRCRKRGSGSAVLISATAATVC